MYILYVCHLFVVAYSITRCLINGIVVAIFIEYLKYFFVINKLLIITGVHSKTISVILIG